MKRNTLWFSVPVLLGVLSLVVRRWQLATAFEGDFAFTRAFAPASIVLVILLVLSCVVFFLLARRQSVDPQLAVVSNRLPFAPGDKLFLVFLVVAAFFMLAAAPLLVKSGVQRMNAFRIAHMYNQNSPGGDNGILTFITAALALLSFFDLLRTAKSIYRGQPAERALWLPIIMDCFWLMDVYRSNAPEPTLWHYAPLMLAVVCSLMFYLEWAGFFGGLRHPRRSLWYAAMTVVLALSTIGGELKNSLLLLSHIAAAMALLMHMPNYVTNLPEPPAAPAEENMEEDTHE